MLCFFRVPSSSGFLVFDDFPPVSAGHVYLATTSASGHNMYGRQQRSSPSQVINDYSRLRVPNYVVNFGLLVDRGNYSLVTEVSLKPLERTLVMKKF